MQQHGKTGRLFLGAVLLGIAGGAPLFPTTVFAVDFANCSQACSGACRLTADVDCNNDSGITLSSGADLDLNGHHLTCSGSCPSSAVIMSGSGNTVKNDASGQASITGPFTYNIDCADRPNSRVSGIKIENTAYQGYGVNECETVDGNVFVGHRSDVVLLQAAITVGTHNGSSVTDNYITNWAYGVFTSTGGVTVDRNTIVIPNGAVQIFEHYGVYDFGSGGSKTYSGNTFFGGGTGSSVAYTYIFRSVNTPGTFLTNFCDPAQPSCQNCTQCANSSGPPTAPVVY